MKLPLISSSFPPSLNNAQEQQLWQGQRDRSIQHNRGRTNVARSTPSFSLLGVLLSPPGGATVNHQGRGREVPSPFLVSRHGVALCRFCSTNDHNDINNNNDTFSRSSHLAPTPLCHVAAHRHRIQCIFDVVEQILDEDEDESEDLPSSISSSSSSTAGAARPMNSRGSSNARNSGDAPPPDGGRVNNENEQKNSPQ